MYIYVYLNISVYIHPCLYIVFQELYILIYIYTHICISISRALFIMTKLMSQERHGSLEILNVYK